MLAELQSFWLVTIYSSQYPGEGYMVQMFPCNVLWKGEYHIYIPKCRVVMCTRWDIYELHYTSYEVYFLGGGIETLQ